MSTTNDTYKTLDLALRVGELLLSCGAGAADAAAQMRNVAFACGLPNITADVTFTELAMSHQPTPDEPALIQIRQVQQRVTDYTDLTAVDHLVRQLADASITRDEALADLARLVSSGHVLPRWAVTVGYGVMGAGVGLMLAGGYVVPLIAGVAAMGIDLIQRGLSRRRIPLFYQQVAGGLFASLLSVGVAAVDSRLEPGLVITTSIVLMLAGVSFVGAIQDALTGFPLTAGARLLEAMLATAGIIAGVSGGLTVAKFLGVSLGEVSPGSTALSDLPFMVCGAAITAAAYAFACYAPYRSIAPIAVIAAVAAAIYHLGYTGGLGITWPSAVAGFLVGLVSYAVSGRVRVPALVVVVSGIVPLLPGLSIYRGLSMLSNGSEGGLLSMVNAAAIAIALSSGVILGEYVAQPLRREARRLETRLAGPRLVGPIAVRTPRRLRRKQGGVG